MKNTVLINEEQALGTDQLLKLTALVYLKEALVTQKYEACRELIDTAKGLGVDPGDIKAVITDYLNTDGRVTQKTNRLRSIKGE